MRPVAATESGESVPFTRRSASSLPARLARPGTNACAMATSSCLIASCRSTACVSSRRLPRAFTVPPEPVVARRRTADASRAGHVKLRIVRRASRIWARAVGRTVESTMSKTPPSMPARRKRTSSVGGMLAAGPSRRGAPAGGAGGSSSARRGNEPSAACSIRAHGFCRSMRSTVTVPGHAKSMPVACRRAAVISGAPASPNVMSAMAAVPRAVRVNGSSVALIARSPLACPATRPRTGA